MTATTIHIRFVSDPAAASLRAGTLLLGGGSPKINYGLGWEEIARPKRPGFSEWTGRSLLRQIVPILFDGLASGESVQPHYDLLEAIAWNRHHDMAPPRIRLYGPIHHPGLYWIIEHIEWGDDALRNEAGILMRQSATVTFMEYQSADIVRRRRPKRRPRRYRVKRGDTLKSIARKQLGSSKRWREILRRNRKKIKDPRELKPGTILVLP